MDNDMTKEESNSKARNDNDNMSNNNGMSLEPDGHDGTTLLRKQGHSTAAARLPPNRPADDEHPFCDWGRRQLPSRQHANGRRRAQQDV